MNFTQIPEPPSYPIIGHMGSISLDSPLASILEIAEKYGPIVRLRLGPQSPVFVSSYDYVAEVCDDKRFEKCLVGELEKLRDAVHDGLFTSRGESEENWGIAHRVLMPAFGPLAVQNMFDGMHDVASQLVLKWARHGPTNAIDVTEDFTRLALDTVALCSMGYRFNSFYREDLHPFIVAMYKVLQEASDDTIRFLPSFLYGSRKKKFHKNIDILRKTANEVLQAVKKEVLDGKRTRKDLTSAMLLGVDPKTGKKMTDESIVDNLITFLVAGHETTAATFSFSLYQLIKHPKCMAETRKEVDRVVGTGPLKVEHMAKLPYLSAVVRETLRLNAPIALISRQAIKDEIIGGQFQVKAGEPIVPVLIKSQQDPAVYGDDADQFMPERMLEEKFDKLMREYPHAWKPFGTGYRGCIGRPFAWQEVILGLALLVQNFNFELDDPSYELKIKQTLTIKPDKLRIRASLREGLTPTMLEHRLAGSLAPTAASEPGQGNAAAQANGTLKPMSVYYGSNAGTCEAMANRLASDASRQGFAASVEVLDMAKEALPKDRPVVIVAASYEGEPTDNARRFVRWIETLEGNELEGVSYAVYGCGHQDWASTYQKIPTLIDGLLDKNGASRMVSLGASDAKKEDMFSEFESWEDTILWPAITKKFGGSTADDDVTSSLQATFSSTRTTTLRQDVREGLVVEEKDIVPAGSARLRKHIAIKLPAGMSYSAGDYLSLLPHNPKEVVARALRRFQLAWDALVTLEASGPTTLPVSVPTSVQELLGSYVELSQPATRRNLSALANMATDEATKASLQSLSTDAYETEVKARRLSVLGALEQHWSLPISFAAFLSMLPPMRVRLYSISSSPLQDPSIATLTYTVIDAPALSGQGRYLGVSTNYLSSLASGDKIQVSIRPSSSSFHLPTDPFKIPIICIAAGTGVAPFRGFIQERHIMLVNARKAGKDVSLAPAILFFGSQGPDDDIYRDEFDAWEKEGAVRVLRAYSRAAEHAEADGCRYVQDRIWAERELLSGLWDEDAMFYLCGSGGMCDAVKETAYKILMQGELSEGKNMSREEAVQWFEGVKNERYAIDVFD
ncbi:cytochrome P450 [Chaetomium sp. MPI-CAGE-AT-0009]|nr:cytochrome P450 [Chaetomium sp. MPI-CAGE-AT-0009]